MTNEEMALICDQWSKWAADDGMQQDAEALKAGAAALRAVDSIRQWNNKVRTASYRDLAVERIWHEASAKVIDLLPEPPEGL